MPTRHDGDLSKPLTATGTVAPNNLANLAFARCRRDQRQPGKPYRRPGAFRAAARAVITRSVISGHGGRRRTALVLITAAAKPVATPINASRPVSTAGVHTVPCGLTV